MSNALSVQIDGNHYKEQKIQPLELAYLIGATPCFTKLAKYITRNKGDRMINLDKAIHCIKIEEEIREASLYHLLEVYPLLSSYPRLDQANILIDLFSDDIHIRDALKAMVQQNYKDAVIAVEKLRSTLDHGIE